MRIADCIRCGAGIGFRNQELCHRCRKRERETALRDLCPVCQKFLWLQPDTGRCARCSRTCVDCGHIVRYKDATRCRVCQRRAAAAMARSDCARCGRRGIIRPDTGWCGTCSRAAPPPLPVLACSQCGELRRKKGPGLCHRCWTNHASRPITQAANLAERLIEPPGWLVEFAEFAVERHCVARACLMVSAVGRLLTDGESQHPQALLERSRTPGRSAGALARTLEAFFVERHLAFGLDQEARLASGRRQRRVEGSPVPLRPAVAAFADQLVRSRERARRAGTLVRTDSTIEGSIAVVRDLAQFLVSERHKSDWSAVDVSDVEAFLKRQPRNRHRRLSALRQFFAWARKSKILLTDPTRSLPPVRSRVLAGDTLTVGEQRRVFRRWTTDLDDVHPHEAFVGILALLHAASSSELRRLRVGDIDVRHRTMRLGERPHPVPLDPASISALTRCLRHRESLGTLNPHLIVTKVTKPRQTPASTAYMSHILDPARTSIKRLRATRILDMIVTLDPKIVAEVLGMNAGGLVAYLADSVDAGRLADRT